jgi:hypothetical protein
VVSLAVLIITALLVFEATSSIYLRLKPKMQARYSKAIAVISTIKFLIREIRINFSKKSENIDGKERIFSVRLSSESNK